MIDEYGDAAMNKTETNLKSKMAAAYGKEESKQKVRGFGSVDFDDDDDEEAIEAFPTVLDSRPSFPFEPLDADNIRYNSNKSFGSRPNTDKLTNDRYNTVTKQGDENDSSDDQIEL